MDGESYEDPSIAEFSTGTSSASRSIAMNDQTWMPVSASRSGADPTGRLAADGVPYAGGSVFYGGTYFPPDGKYGRPGLRTVLASVLDAWRTRRGQLEAQASAIRGCGPPTGRRIRAGELSSAIIDAAVDGMIQVFDPVNGGFGSQPKFPHPGAIRFLLARWWTTPLPASNRSRRPARGEWHGAASAITWAVASTATA
jgi:hypothetical protein